MTREREYQRNPYDIAVSICLEDCQLKTIYLARWRLQLEWQGRQL